MSTNSCVKVLTRKNPLSEREEKLFQEKSWGVGLGIDPISWKALTFRTPYEGILSSFEERMIYIWEEIETEDGTTPTKEKWDERLSRERALASIQKKMRGLGIYYPTSKRLLSWGVTSRKVEGFLALYNKVGKKRVPALILQGILSLVGRKFEHHPGWVIEAVAWRQGLTQSPFEGRQPGIESAAKVWHLQKLLGAKVPLPRRIAEHCGGLPLHRRMEAVEIALSMQGNWDVEEFWKRLSSSRRNSREVIASFPGWKDSRKLKRIFKGSLPLGFLEFADTYPRIGVCQRLMEKGIKVSLFQKIECGSFWDDEEYKEYLLKVFFGGDWKKFLNLPSVGYRDVHDLSFELCIHKTQFSAREKEILPVLLEVVSLQKAVEFIEKVPTSLSIREVKGWVSARLASTTYPLAKHLGFALEAIKWSLKESSYHKWEERFISSQEETPSPFPTDKVWGEEGLKGYFLKRSDPRGVFLGEYTNCCQHPGGVGSACAKHGQTSLDGGFFVVEDRTGKIIAQSWVWADSKQNGVCFDNIETLTLGSREEAVERIYRDAAQELYHLGVAYVTLGRGDLEFGENTRVRLSPYSYEGYRDSKTQTLIQEEDLLDI